MDLSNIIKRTSSLTMPASMYSEPTGSITMLGRNDIWAVLIPIYRDKNFATKAVLFSCPVLQGRGRGKNNQSYAIPINNQLTLQTTF